MAQVDFSNAVLDVYSGTPLPNANYLYLNNQAGFVNDEYDTRYITSNASKTIITNTPSKASILYTGTFTESGTEIYTYGSPKWRISNISFNSGDTYAFVIDIEVSGNT